MQRILEQTSTLIPADLCTFNWLSSSHVDYVVRLATPEAHRYDDLRPIFDRLWNDNPLIDHFERTGDTRALTWADVEGDGAWRSGPLFREYYEVLGVRHQLALRVPSPPGTVAGLACSRAAVDFNDRERALLTAFGRHVIARNGQLAEHAGLRAAMGRRGWRTHLVGADGTLADESEDAVVADASGILYPSVADLVERQRATTGDGRSVPGDPEEVELPDGPFVAFLVPSAMPPYLLFERPLASEDHSDFDSAMLRALGLSARESEVVSRLATGATNRQIADSLGIAVGTVKKHLQRVFAVLGVETRAAAAAKAVRLLR